jgi:hypothetical protein
MATKLDLINNIMRRIREPEVTSSEDSAYSKLVASIVAESYEEVLDEWNWRPVASNMVMELPANTMQIVPDVTNVKDGFVPDGRLLLVREKGWAFGRVYDKPWVEDITLTDSGAPMNEVTLPEYLDTIRRERLLPQEVPSIFAVQPLPDESVVLHFWQPANQITTIAMAFHRRPARLDATASTDNVNIEIPYRPVQELALMYTLNERGEEMGEPGNLAHGRYIQALSTAKEADIKAHEHANQYDWQRD